VKKLTLALLAGLACSSAYAASQTQTVSSATTSSIMYVDSSRFYQGVGIICTVNSGTLTYSIQVSGDGGTPSHWNNHDTLASLTASANGNLAYPVTAMRINVSAFTSGSVTCSVVQADSERPWPR
jgi:hypothetical protein